MRAVGTGGWGGVLGHMLEVRSPDASAGSLHRNEVTDTFERRNALKAPGKQRSGCTTAPTDQASQLGPQFCRGLVGAAAAARLAAGTLGREPRSP